MKKERKDLYTDLPAGFDSYSIYRELENNGTIDQIRRVVVEKLKTETSIAGEDGFITAEQHIINEINRTIVANKLTDIGTSGNSSEGIRRLNRNIQNFIYGSTTHKVSLKATLDLCFGEIDKFVYSSPIVRDQLIAGVNSAMDTIHNNIQKGEGNSSSKNKKTIVYICDTCGGCADPLDTDQCKGRPKTFKCPKCETTLDCSQITKKYMEKPANNLCDTTVLSDSGNCTTSVPSPSSEKIYESNQNIENCGSLGSSGSPSALIVRDSTCQMSESESDCVKNENEERVLIEPVLKKIKI